jgi:hypothetical protein
MSTPNHLRPTAVANQRRSQRILLSVRLRVSGKHVDETSFTEHTTLIVNAHGALIQLREAVKVGQPLSLNNVATGEEARCTVIDVNEGSNGVLEVGVEFSDACPRFWRVSFPPADWSARSPEAKRYASSQNPAAGPVKVPPPKK